jgi:hypothetical protein
VVPADQGSAPDAGAARAAWLEQLAQGVVVLDHSLAVLSCNPASLALVRRAPADLAGKPPADVLATGHLEELSAAERQQPVIVGVLTKPYSLNSLLELVAQHCRPERMKDE